MLYRYEGDVLPQDPSAGWNIGSPCQGVCSESIENGNFVLRWPVAWTFATYGFFFDTPAPATLWIEWRFRSNHPIGPNFNSCDAGFSVGYLNVVERVNMYGDAATSFEGGDFITGLALDEFHTYRFESLDGIAYRVSANGVVFIDQAIGGSPVAGGMGIVGWGGCGGDWIPDMRNEWGYVRYGTIAYGESQMAADPPEGFLSLQEHGLIDRFTVTFDAPNYVYVDEITVESTGGATPIVLQTRRRDFDEPDTVEIVLDRPLPLEGVTTFTFDDGVATNTVQYEYVLDPIDTDGDGVPNDEDADPLDPHVCRDVDGDTCDDCAVGVDGFGPLPDFDPNNDGVDTDADGICDAGDADRDNDGIANDADSDPLDPQVCRDLDADGCDDCAVGVDGFGPQADFDPAADGPDADADGVCDVTDNCINAPNPAQEDGDIDGVGDVCDNCVAQVNSQQFDTDGDGFGNACEECDTDANKTRPGICGCGTPDEGDADGDTVLDCVDLCEGLDDRIDTDDNGVPDCAEHIPTVSAWGLVVLALLLLTAGKVFFSRRAGHAPSDVTGLAH